MAKKPPANTRQYVEKKLRVRWFPQEELFHCGPASAQMVLNYHGAAPKHFKPAAWRWDLWDEIKAATRGARLLPLDEPGAFPKQVCYKCSEEPTCWSTTPEALAKVLNKHLPVTKPVFSVSYNDDDDAAMVRIIRGLDLQKPSPVVVLVYGELHWLVAVGYRIGDHTSTSMPPVDVGGYQLNGMYIRDPWENRPLHLVPADEWLDMLEGIACGSEEQEDRRCVVEPIPPIGISAQPMMSAAAEPRTAGTRQRTRLLVSKDAVQVAQRIASELVESTVWSPALKKSRAAEPRLVQRIDASDSFYYMVPFRREGKITAEINVDAKTGTFVSAGGIERAGQSLPAPVVPADVLCNRRAGKAGAGVARPEALSDSVFVWRPCRESSSRFQPFSVLTVNGQIVYVRADGAVFSHLTTRGAG